MTSGDTVSTIFSRASAAGPTPYGWQDGPTTEWSGLEAVPALCSQSQAEKRSARYAKAQTLCRMLDELATSYAANASMNGLPTPGTYGRKCGDLSARDALDTSLENRLREAVERLGSPLFELRWKYSDMTLGPQVLTLRASAPRISGNGCSSWGSPNTLDHLKSVNWEERKKKGGCSNLKDQVTLLTQASWGTPATSDNYKAKSGTSRSKGQENWRLGNQARLAFGPTPTGFIADPNYPVTPKADGGQLNPEFTLWLMGFPPEWASCGALAMPSSRKSRRNSSGRTWSPPPSQLPELQLGPTFTRPPAAGAA